MSELVDVHPSAELAPDVSIGGFTVIAAGARVGAGTRIGHHVTIHAGTEIGPGARIDDGAVLGKLPMRAHRSATTRDHELPPCRVGESCAIGTGAVVYRGATLERGVLVADLATVREDVTIGELTIVGRGVTVENRCTIGARCKLEANAYITALSELGDDVFVAPCVATSNDNFLGRTTERFKHFCGAILRRGARVGANATLLPGVVVEEDGVVAAGALATGDVPARTIVAGIPAKPFRPVPPEQLLENQP